MAAGVVARPGRVHDRNAKLSVIRSTAISTLASPEEEGRWREGGRGERVRGDGWERGATLSPYTVKTDTFHGSINCSIARDLAGPSLVGGRDTHNIHPNRQHLHIHSSTVRGVFSEYAIRAACSVDTYRDPVLSDGSIVVCRGIPHESGYQETDEGGGEGGDVHCGWTIWKGEREAGIAKREGEGGGRKLNKAQSAHPLCLIHTHIHVHEYIMCIGIAHGPAERRLLDQCLCL